MNNFHNFILNLKQKKSEANVLSLSACSLPVVKGFGLKKNLQTYSHRPTELETDVCSFDPTVVCKE